MPKTVSEIITENIVKALEAGVVPWRKPWATVDGMPQNLLSRKPYRGINIFLTYMQRFGSPFWVTFNQCGKKGGKIRKGEHGTPIVFWKFPEPDPDNLDANGKPKRRPPICRFYKVWNVEQTEGLDYPQPTMIAHDPIPVCEALVAGWEDCPEIVVRGGRACYNRADDKIAMPDFGRFDKPEGYYSTLFHEMVHATGHKSRLDRLEGGGMGSGSYSREELTAEMGAAFLCGHCGIETKTLDDSAAYIDHWVKVLKGDSKLVISAGSKAQAAYDLILGVKAYAEPSGDNGVASTKSDNDVAVDKSDKVMALVTA